MKTTTGTAKNTPLSRLLSGVSLTISGNSLLLLFIHKIVKDKPT